MPLQVPEVQQLWRGLLQLGKLLLLLPLLLLLLLLLLQAAGCFRGLGKPTAACASPGPFQVLNKSQEH